MRFSFIALLIWAPFVSAEPFGPDEYCSRACEIIIRKAQFHTIYRGIDWRQEACTNDLKITSGYLCLRIFCTPEESAERLAESNATCQLVNSPLPSYSIIDSYTDEDINNLHHLISEDIFEIPAIIFNEVVIPSKVLYELAYRTLDVAHFEKNIRILYGFGMYYFWLVVVGIGIFSHFARFLVSMVQQEQQWQPVAGNEEDAEDIILSNEKRGIFAVPYSLLKKHVTVPATFGYTRSQNISWCTIPTRIQSLTITAFIVLNIATCSVGYNLFIGNMYWYEPSTQAWRYVADRTGVISTANFILIWLFGVRNNLLLWLTGWDFATYNNFHRWIARIATVQAVIHSVAYTILIVNDGSLYSGWRFYLNYLQLWWFVAGVLATIFMVAVCCFSVYPLRRHFYEIFLAVHIILSVALIITMWYHVVIFDNAYYTRFVWPCAFIWILDRLLRVLRILSFNLKFWSTKAVAIYDDTCDIVRLTVPYSQSFIEPRPGTFYYITSLDDRWFWQSHPFTLGYSTTVNSSESSLALISPPSSTGILSPPSYIGIPPTGREERPGSRNSNTSFELQTLLKPLTAIQFSSLVFIIRPYNGFTRRLKEAAMHGPANLRVLIDGPYGETQPFHTYENVLFIVGGTGIAVPLSYLAKLLEKGSRTTSLKIIWAVREHEFLVDSINSDFRGFLENEKLDLTAYVTRDAEGKEDERARFRVCHGRPDVYAEVEEAARDSRDRRLAVVACGPGQMVDDARRAVVNMLGKGYSKIEYFEESFNW